MWCSINVCCNVNVEYDMTIGPKKQVSYTCHGCDNLTRDFELGEGWYQCYCKGKPIGCFFPGEDIWPNTHQNPSEFKCPVMEDLT